MKTFLIGQGVGGIFCSALQVVALIVGTSSEASALIYFLVGTLLTAVTLILYHVVHHQGKTLLVYSDLQKMIIKNCIFRFLQCNHREQPGGHQKGSDQFQGSE